MLGSDGKVTEGPGACVFLRKGEAVITPDTVTSILEVSRDTAIRLLEDELQLKVVERSVDRTEFYTADEAFFASTGVEIVPIASLDGIPIGDQRTGPITASLQATMRPAVD